MHCHVTIFAPSKRDLSMVGWFLLISIKSLNRYFLQFKPKNICILFRNRTYEIFHNDSLDSANVAGWATGVYNSTKMFIYFFLLVLRELIFKLNFFLPVCLDYNIHQYARTEARRKFLSEIQFLISTTNNWLELGFLA